MKKLRIGIDFDDVLVDCNTALQDFHNRHYGTTLTKEDVTTYSFEKLWGCTKDEERIRLSQFLKSEQHDGIEPIDGAVEAIHELSIHHELYIITARVPEAREVTRKLLRHFPDVFKHIHFTGTSAVTNLKITKAEICKKESIDIFIDDHINNVLSVSLAGIPSLLLDQPWNRNEPLPNGVKRVYSWGDILNEIDQITLV